MNNVLNDPEYLRLVEYFRSKGLETSTFNDFLNQTNKSVDFDHPCVEFEARDEYIGNPYYRTLHGGVIAAMLDTAGGHAVWLKLFTTIRGKSLDTQIRKVSRVGSINLRVDYLKPGKGKKFIATASILRMGKKVAVTRMELRNEKQTLIAVGTGTYTAG